MSHLSLETIARLVEDAPNTDEAAHLESCVECRTELAAMAEDVHALSMLPDMTAAPDQWEAIEQRLLHEGLIRTAGERAAAPGGRHLRMMQIAAALTLFIGGSLAGRLTAQPEIISTAVTPDAPAVDDTPRTVLPSTPVSDGAPVLVVDDAPVEPPVTRRAPDVTLASNDGFGRSNPTTVEDAAQLLRQTEELYLAALTRYAELASQSEPGDLVARYAALQSIILTTQAALNQTPADPIINGYHLTALAQRDATLRQVAAATNERWY